MSLSSLVTTTTTSVPSSLSSRNPLHHITKKASSSSTHAAKQVSVVSCEQRRQGGEAMNQAMDRRNVLLGLGGICGATASTIGNQAKIAIAAPMQPPDLGTCHLAYDTAAKENIQCCPPYSSANIVDFVPPSSSERLRVRKPAHKLSPDELDKFKTAVSKMKQLDEDDPWSYMQQATIHCTYCNGAFDQAGFPNTVLQVHGSWLFLPWHRYYLYFWERILGKLIDDATFAVPYWNWDNPAQMKMPDIYKDEYSPLYDDLRNHDHFDALMDFKYKFGAPNPTPEQEKDVKRNNLRTLYNTYMETLGRPNAFMGGPVRAGEVAKDEAGTLENLHVVAHLWTGLEAKPHYNMGDFATAARDTLFFGHHANIDRLWSGYRSLRGGKVEFNDPDWLEASFIFYDENRQVVKVKVKDCLDTESLGYTYRQDKAEWKDSRRAYKLYMKAKKKFARSAVSLNPVSEFGTQPRILDKPIRVLVQRPKTLRSKNEKEDDLEMLVIDDIGVEHGTYVRFDVYIAKPIERLIGPDYGEIAGSFVRIPHNHGKKQAAGPQKAKLELGITNLLDDIDAEASESLVVTLVPADGKVTIGGVRIKLIESDL